MNSAELSLAEVNTSITNTVQNDGILNAIYKFKHEP